jgi:hypothetical protein
MRTLYPLLLLSLLLVGACSYLWSAKKVECCEKKAGCCYSEMCCLPRYAKAAGVEPKAFTPEVPVYGTAQDLEPAQGEVIVKQGWLSQLNPFGGSAGEQKPQPQSQSQDEQAQQNPAAEESEDDDGFFGRLWPF